MGILISAYFNDISCQQSLSFHTLVLIIGFRYVLLVAIISYWYWLQASRKAEALHVRIAELWADWPPKTDKLKIINEDIFKQKIETVSTFEEKYTKGGNNNLSDMQQTEEPPVSVQLQYLNILLKYCVK